MNRHDEFLKAYGDFPTQDNEGFIPDRGGFKAGFGAAWDLLEKRTPFEKFIDTGFTLEEHLYIIERSIIESCMDLCEGVCKSAAHLLGMPRTRLVMKRKKFCFPMQEYNRKKLKLDSSVVRYDDEEGTLG